MSPSHLGAIDLAIDLGTSNTRVYVPGVGVALDEPSVIAMQGDDVLAAGGKAKAMIGRVPESVQVITPLRRGTCDNSGSLWSSRTARRRWRSERWRSSAAAWARARST